MGSDSDWPMMKAAADVLAEFGIASEAKVISAHRTRRTWNNTPAARANAACASSSPARAARRICRA